MSKRIICGIFAAVFAVSAVNITGMAKSEEDTFPIYKASEYFDESFESKNPNNTPWTWQYYKTGEGYKDMQYPCGWISGYADDLSDGQGKAWVEHSDTNYQFTAAVGRYYMTPQREVNGYTPDIEVRAVRTFTAPYDGRIEVSADDGSGNSRIIGSDKNNPGAYVRILKNETMVWPRNVSENGIQIPCGNGINAGYVAAEKFDLDIRKGDKLYFEVHMGGNKWNTWSKRTYWNPVVQYTDKYEIPSADYQASKYFDESYSSKNPQNGPWTWQYYSPQEGYADMRYPCGWISGYADDLSSGQGKAWVEHSNENYQFAASVGKYYMCPQRNVDGTYDPRIAIRAVRTFTAPHTGKISVTADDGNGNSRILGSAKNKNQGAFVRVMFKGRKVWPLTADLNGERVPAGSEMETGAVNVDETFLDVKKGDKLYFEVHTGGGHYDYNFWDKRTYWDPVIKYVNQSSYADDVKVTDTDGNQLTDYEAVAASGSCNVSVSVSSVYKDYGLLDIAAAVQDKNGKLISVGMEAANLKQDDTHTYNLKLNGINGAEGGSLKLFAFKDMQKLYPVKLDGIDTVLMKSDDSWMPEYNDITGDFYMPYTGMIGTNGGESEYVTAGEKKTFSEPVTLHYTDVFKDTISITPESVTKDGCILFEATDFLNKAGVRFRKENSGITGNFNGADIEIPYSGDTAYYDKVNIELSCPITAAGDKLYVSSEYFDCFYGVSVNGQNVSAAINRPEKTIDYEKAMESLTGGEEVLDGEEIYNIKQGNLENDGYEMKSYELTDDKFGKVLRMTTGAKPITAYSYRLWSNTILTAKPYSYRDVLVASFWARATNITDDTGAAYVGVTLERTDSWKKDISYEVQIDSEWKKYYIPAEAAADVKAGGAWLGLHCGFKPQTVEIADFKIVNYGRAVDISSLEKNIKKSETYKGREQNALWREQALKRILKYRTNEVTVKVVDKNGNPVSGAQVNADMTKNSFIFGTEESGYNREKLSPYIADNFNGITASYAKLGSYNETDIKNVHDYAKEHNMFIRGHALVYDDRGFMWNDDSEECKKWDMYKNVYGDTEEEKRSKFDAYIKDRLEKFTDFDHWDVLNEPDTVYQLRRRFGNGFAAEWFKSFDKYNKQNPKQAKAYVNSCAVSGFTKQDRAAKNFADMIDDLKNCGAKIDGGGIQCHLRGIIYPQDLYNQIDTVANSVDEVTITEFDIKAMTADNKVKQEDEPQLEADLVRDILIAAYSNPKTAGFFTWGICDRNQECGLLLDEDYNEKPTYKVWRELVKGEWETKASGITDKNGEFTFRGHLGEYSVSSSGASVPYTLTQGEKGSLTLQLN